MLPSPICRSVKKDAAVEEACKAEEEARVGVVAGRRPALDMRVQPRMGPREAEARSEQGSPNPASPPPAASPSPSGDQPRALAPPCERGRRGTRKRSRLAGIFGGGDGVNSSVTTCTGGGVVCGRKPRGARKANWLAVAFPGSQCAWPTPTLPSHSGKRRSDEDRGRGEAVRRRRPGSVWGRLGGFGSSTSEGGAIQTVT